MVNTIHGYNYVSAEGSDYYQPLPRDCALGHDSIPAYNGREPSYISPLEYSYIQNGFITKKAHKYSARLLETANAVAAEIIQPTSSDSQGERSSSSRSSFCPRWLYIDLSDRRLFSITSNTNVSSDRNENDSDRNSRILIGIIGAVVAVGGAVLLALWDGKKGNLERKIDKFESNQQKWEACRQAYSSCPEYALKLDKIVNLTKEITENKRLSLTKKIAFIALPIITAGALLVAGALIGGTLGAGLMIGGALFGLGAVCYWAYTATYSAVSDEDRITATKIQNKIAQLKGMDFYSVPHQHWYAGL